MFFILSKILFYICMPMIWIVSLLIYSLISKIPVRRKRAIIASLTILLLFGNEFIFNEVMTAWEEDPVPVQSLSGSKVAVVLTGVTNTNKESVQDRVYFQKGGDRVLHTVQLFKENKIDKIIISGGSGKILGGGVLESEQLKKVFLYCGIPDSNLIVENQSRNTRENALYTKRLLDSLHINNTPLVITSAFHIKRAKGCFNKVGINPEVYPVDVYTWDRSFHFNKLFIPSESALSKWALLIHEVLGYIVYKIVGYC